jgi:hypothetical protein
MLKKLHLFFHNNSNDKENDSKNPSIENLVAYNK